MPRIAVIGNAGGGKSTLARRLAAERGLEPIEVDRLLWRDGWVPVPAAEYEAAHDGVIAGEAWIVDGLGRRESIPHRLARATAIILVDLPLWIHFWLAAERQVAWAGGRLAHAPAGLVEPPPTEALFRTIWEVDRDWMPKIRDLCSQAEDGGTSLTRIATLEELAACRLAA